MKYFGDPAERCAIWLAVMKHTNTNEIGDPAERCATLYSRTCLLSQDAHQMES